MSNHRLSLTIFALFCFLAQAMCLTWAAQVQTVSVQTNINSQNSPPDERHEFSSPEEEIKYKASVRREISSHKELVERAEEITQLGSEIRSAYEHDKSLAAVDLKKLDRMEKLARKIRSGAGGSSDDDIKDSPQQLESTILRLDALSVKIAQDVKKSSRLVVAAGMIENSNEIIALIKHLRTLIHP